MLQYSTQGCELDCQTWNTSYSPYTGSHHCTEGTSQSSETITIFCFHLCSVTKYTVLPYNPGHLGSMYLQFEITSKGRIKATYQDIFSHKIFHCHQQSDHNDLMNLHGTLLSLSHMDVTKSPKSLDISCHMWVKTLGTHQSDTPLQI